MRKPILLFLAMLLLSASSAQAGLLDLIRKFDPTYLRSVDVTVKPSSEKDLAFDVQVNKESLETRPYWVEVNAPIRKSKKHMDVTNQFSVWNGNHSDLHKLKFKAGDKFELDITPNFATYCAYIFSLQVPLYEGIVSDYRIDEGCELQIYFSGPGIKSLITQTPFHCGLLMDSLEQVEGDWYEKNELESLPFSCRQVL
jgi:hypothetical protein